jgi:endonuclease-3 related protein
VKDEMPPSIKKVIDLLLKTYSKESWWPADSPWEIAVGAILTQNTNWQNVTKAIRNLKDQNLLDIQSIAKKNIKVAIRPSGYFNQKARYLKTLANFVLTQAKGDIEDFLLGDISAIREDLLSIKGVGRETADTILLYAGNRPIFIIDSYTKRLYHRLGFHSPYQYDHVQDFFHKNLDKEVNLYQTLHGAIVDHCKSICKKTKPLCDICSLNQLCLFAKTNSQGKS